MADTLNPPGPPGGAIKTLNDVCALLSQILTSIQASNALLQQNMVTSDELTALFSAITALINAKTADDAEIKSLTGQVTTLTSQIADLSDPNLEAQVTALTAAAAAATPAPA